MNIRKPVGQRAGSAGHAVSHFVNYLTLIHTIVKSVNLQYGWMTGRRYYRPAV